MLKKLIFRRQKSRRLALKEAFPCDQVWVAEGTYIPADEPDESASFQLENGYDGHIKAEEEKQADFVGFFV